MIHDDKPPLDEALLEHHGVKGMRWGVRRDATGRRPVGVALNRSKFGRVANANAQRYMRKQTAKVAKVKPVSLDTPHPDYTSKMRRSDQVQWGKRAVKRINRHMNSGLSRQQALHKEGVHQMKMTALRIGGTVAAAYVLNSVGNQAYRSSLSKSATTSTAKVGEAAIKKTFDKSAWDASVKSLSSDIAKANFEQDQWMRSVGLGAVVNNRK